jgi:hypothetical protein
MIKINIRISNLIVLFLFLNNKIMTSVYTSNKAGFSIQFKNEISQYRTIAVFLLPEEMTTFKVLDNNPNHRYIFQCPKGTLIENEQKQIQWKAPDQTGWYQAKIENIQTLEAVLINVFVMIPFSELKGEYLNGYRIGTYPSIPLKQLPIYKPPRGFIEVTKETENVFVSPHFQLKEFVSKQESGYPRYVVLKERLLLKLELILERMNEKGYKCQTFHVMSGYRTPYYNKAIGNVIYSRHVWGGAVDIYIDENPRDGMMDDLNKDGLINYKDAAVIYDIIDEMVGKPFYDPFIGGLGRYRKTLLHGPFVHVDVRGFRARWGD